MTTLPSRLARAVEEARLRPLEWALGDWCLRHGGSDPVALGMVLVVRALAEGHTCLELPRNGPAVPGEEPSIDHAGFLRALRDSDLVGGPGEPRPLILEDGRLYLQRYWQYEERLAAGLRTLLAAAPRVVDPQDLLPGGGLFDYGWVTGGETHWQAVAAFVAERQRFCVISGGPGTGKTYTVLRLMRRLLEADLAREREPSRIRLAAPTGKAAARMMESIRGGLEGMALQPAVREALPQQAFTLHRLLGFRAGSVTPIHDRNNPLAADVIIVDEASMVDLPMMTKLLEAIPAHGRLILLGDRYQLASVESGSVLAALCEAGGINQFSTEQRAAAGPLLREDAAPSDTPSPLSDHVVTLQTSHRFRPDSPIGRLAAAVNAGDEATAMAAMQERQETVVYRPEAGRAARSVLVERMAEAFAPLAGERNAEAGLALLGKLRLLTATRVGPAGSETLNAEIHRCLAIRQDFDPDRTWYHGRPVIITRNDYRAGLFNGDTGVALRAADGHLRVWFQAERGLRSLLPTALPQHETVYAMTVHKSQGSEFSHVVVLLPEIAGPLLSRELLYTGITRARDSLEIVATPAVLAETIRRRSLRMSGLSTRLRRILP